MPFRPDLQGLRAIAIVLVVLAHAKVSWFSGGFIGVDVFFVLSGYLITGLLIQEWRTSGRIRMLRFYGRRLKRLLPALVFMLFMTLSLAAWLLSDSEARAQIASAPFAATWTSNFYFALRSVEYFNELEARDLFLHTWSLGVEEQFYLIWPAVLLAVGGLSTTGRDTANQRTVWLLSLGFLFVTSLALALFWTATKPSAAFYMMPSRIWQFALGGLLFVGLQRSTADTPAETPPGWCQTGRCARVLLALGLVLILGSAVLLHPNLAYPGLWALAPSLGAAMVIAAGQPVATQPGGVLAHPILVWLGDRSYSWYLWHWPIFTLGFSLGLEQQSGAVFGLALLSLLTAIFSYRCIELPFWKGRLSLAEPRRFVLPCLLAMTLLIAFFVQIEREIAPSQSTYSASADRWRSDVPVIYDYPCDSWYHDARVRPCVFSTEEATHTVVLLGDSVGAQWFSMVPEIFPEPRWRVMVLTKSSCPLVDEDYFYPRIGQIYSVCNEWRNEVLSRLEQQPPDVLIMGSAATYEFTKPQWIDGSARVLARLSKAIETVFVIPGTPSLGFDGPGCVERHLSPDGHINPANCLASNRMAQVAPITDYLHQSAAGFANVHVIDLNDLVCPDNECRAVSADGVVVFRDNQHLSDSFVRARTPAVRERLRIFGTPLEGI